MAKHNLGDKVKHSRYGEGIVTAVAQKMETPPEYDEVKLDGEYWNLHARMKEIERIKARGKEPRPVDVYQITYEGGRKQEDVSDLGIEKLKSRL